MLRDSLIALLVGFILTGIFGTLFATFLQTRLWKRQDAVSQARNDREQRLAAFGEITALLDARLYNMRRVAWSLQLTVRGVGTLDLGESLESYREHLRKWNESLNRPSALIQIYFGEAARQELRDLRLDVEQIGAGLDMTARAYLVGALTKADDLPDMATRLDALEDRIYQLNLALVTALSNPDHTVEVGRSADGVGGRQLAIGMQGSDVTDLQQGLREHGMLEEATPGLFDWHTHLAVRAAQSSSTPRSAG